MPSTILALFLLLSFGTYGDQSTFTLGMLAMCLVFDVLAFAATDILDPMSTSKQLKRFTTYSAVDNIMLCIAHGILRISDWETLGLCLLAHPPFIAFFLLQHGDNMEPPSEACVDTPKVAPAVKVVPVASDELLISLQDAAIDEIDDFARDETRDMVAQHKCQKPALADALSRERGCSQDFADTVFERERRYKQSARLLKAKNDCLSSALTHSKHACSNAVARVEQLSGVASDVQSECSRLSAKSIEEATRYATLKTASNKQSEDYETQLKSRTKTCEALRGNLTISLNSIAGLDGDLRQKDESIVTLKSELRTSEDNNANLTLDFSLALKTEEAKRQSAQSTVVAADNGIYRLRDEMAEDKESLRLIREELANFKLNRDVALLGRESLERELASSKVEIEEMKELHAAAWSNAEEMLGSSVSSMEEAKAEAWKLRHEVEELKVRGQLSLPSSRKRSLSEPSAAPQALCLSTTGPDTVEVAHESKTETHDTPPELQNVRDTLEEENHGENDHRDEDHSLLAHDKPCLDDSSAPHSSFETSESAADDTEDDQAVTSADDGTTADILHISSPDGSSDTGYNDTSSLSIPSGPSKKRRRGQGPEGMLNRALRRAAKREKALLETSSAPTSASDAQNSELVTQITAARPAAMLEPQRGTGVTDSRWASRPTDRPIHAPTYPAEHHDSYSTRQQYASYPQPQQYGHYSTLSQTAYAASHNNAPPGYISGGRAPLTPPLQENEHTVRTWIARVTFSRSRLAHAVPSYLCAAKTKMANGCRVVGGWRVSVSSSLTGRWQDRVIDQVGMSGYKDEHARQAA
ncbi:hypothetical protein LTR95_012587 [Oleoguttula sp. CCFEE 5521]